MRKGKMLIFEFLAPAMLIFSIVFIYPIMKTAAMSFFKISHASADASTWEFIGISNYQELLGTSLFQSSLWNLFRIWLVGGILVLSAGLLFAVILNSGIKGKKFFRAIIYLPNIISAVALATMWLQYVYNNRFGLLKNFFTSIGWEGMAAIQWTDTQHKFWALLIAYCFGMVGYHMLIFSSGIEKISREYYEASEIDGAGKIAQFQHITWPLLRGVLKTNITMWSVSSAAFFIWSQLFSSVTADTQTITPMVYMYLQTFGGANAVTERNAGMGAAVGVILSVLVVTAFVLANRIVKEEHVEL